MSFSRTLEGLAYAKLRPPNILHFCKTGKTGKKIKTTNHQDYTCRMCGKGQESVAHVLAGCSSIAKTKYLERHDSVLRILFFEILSKYNLLPREEQAWYERISPKSVY